MRTPIVVLSMTLDYKNHEIIIIRKIESTQDLTLSAIYETMEGIPSAPFIHYERLRPFRHSHIAILLAVCALVLTIANAVAIIWMDTHPTPGPQGVPGPQGSQGSQGIPGPAGPLATNYTEITIRWNWAGPPSTCAKQTVSVAKISRVGLQIYLTMSAGSVGNTCYISTGYTTFPDWGKPPAQGLYSIIPSYCFIALLTPAPCLSTFLITPAGIIQPLYSQVVSMGPAVVNIAYMADS
jgi:hypothetical protein